MRLKRASASDSDNLSDSGGGLAAMSEPSGKPSGNPFQDMCTMVGFMTIVWAWAEHGLEHMVWNVAGCGFEVRGHTRIPVSLKNKIDYLKKALSDVPCLKALEEDGRALLKRFGSMKKRRGDLVHGAMFRSPINLGHFEASRFDTEGLSQTHRLENVSIADVVRFNGDVQVLAADTMRFLDRFVLALSPS